MGDLLRQLNAGDVDQLTPSSVVSCPTTLARRVTSRLARRRVLDVYVNSRKGSARRTHYYTLSSNVLCGPRNVATYNLSIILANADGC